MSAPEPIARTSERGSNEAQYGKKRAVLVAESNLPTASTRKNVRSPATPSSTARNTLDDSRIANPLMGVVLRWVTQAAWGRPWRGAGTDVTSGTGGGPRGSTGSRTM